jgi:DNA-binding transcriptional LysR family regulator
VLLTDAGVRLCDYARRILDLHSEAREAVTGQKARQTGELSLAASSTPGEHLLPKLLDAFRHQHPDIQVRATVTDSQAVLAQVEHGKAHLGLIGGKSNGAHLEYRRFAVDTLALVVPAGHPWSRRRRVSLEQFCRQPLILREPGSGSRWCLERALTAVGKSLADVQAALELGSNEAIKEAVLRGMGVAVLSTQVVEKDVQAGRLRALQVTGLTLQREMFIVWHPRRALPIPARLFLHFIETNAPADSGS